MLWICPECNHENGMEWWVCENCHWQIDEPTHKNYVKVFPERCICGVTKDPEKYGKTHLHDCPAINY